ncbi:MAG: RHS repeat protein [Alcanivorax sp.]|nr:RHS repeat protein [Alcanivorax sp.]
MFWGWRHNYIWAFFTVLFFYSSAVHAVEGWLSGVIIGLNCNTNANPQYYWSCSNPEKIKDIEAARVRDGSVLVKRDSREINGARHYRFLFCPEGPWNEIYFSGIWRLRNEGRQVQCWFSDDDVEREECPEDVPNVFSDKEISEAICVNGCEFRPIAWSDEKERKTTLSATGERCADPEKNNECDPATGANMVGNPVNAFVGNKIEKEEDYAGSSDPLSFVRYYNGIAFRQSVVDSLGPRWRHGFQVQLNGGMAEDDPIMRLGRPSGNSYVFREEDGVWVPDPDVRYKLEAITENGESVGWRVFTPENRIELFDVQGRLTQISALSGDSVSLTYDDSDRLVQVEDRRGRALTFTYANGNIVSVTLPDGRVTIP